MTTVIIGGSGMLLKATEWMIEKEDTSVILCSRNPDKYGHLIVEKNVCFHYFDFQDPRSYKELKNSINLNSISTLLVWVHSPYYEMLNDFMNQFDFKNIYLVQGSTSRTFSFDKQVQIIKLGKHPYENRWLTQEEISDLVINVIRHDY